MTDPDKKPSNEQSRRRTAYALNVTAMVVIAMVLVVILNWWLGYRRFIRFDFTATRRYSLSAQTQKVLGELKGDYRIVTLFGNSYSPAIDPYLNQVRDLVEEYGRRSDHITVQQILPGRDEAQLDILYGDLAERYKTTLQPLREAIQEAQSTLDQFQQAGLKLVPALEALEKNPALGGQSKLKDIVEQVRLILSRLGQQIEEPMERVKRSLDEPMPDYQAAKTTLTQLFSDLDARVLTIVVDEFQSASKDDKVHASVRDQLLPLIEQLEHLRGMIKPRLEALRAIQSSQEYDDLRSQLQRQDSVALLSKDQVRLIPLNDMFRQPDPGSGATAGQELELRFQGEEKLTGTLVSLQMKKPPLVVLVNTTGTPVLGRGNPQTTYNQVAERLRSANMRVQEWNPVGGGTDMFGRPQPPQPAPQPEQGQKAIWVLLPTAPPNPRNPMAGMAVNNAIATVKQRMEAGDGALITVAASGGARFGAPDPAVDLLKPYGITVQNDRVIVQEVAVSEDQTQAVMQHTVDHWPDAMDVSKALSGMPGIFFYASPMVLGKVEGAKRWPLAELHGKNLWAERDLQSLPNNAKRDEEEAGDSFIVAAAAQKGDSRVIAVADPIWATDFIVTLGGIRILGSDDVIGARFPGNAELFVNSVYWLAGLDQLIAASPRSQDIRRIESISPQGLVALRWTLLLGMPLATIAAGLAVWSVRRRA